MSVITTGDSAHTAGTSFRIPDRLQERLAEAACFAVLRRIAPVLRHDVAGLMQPVGMLMMVLQRRVQMPEPDLQAIAKNVTSVSALAKEATAGCMNAMGWMASREDAAVSLRSSVNEAAILLSVELSTQGLEISNIIPDDSAIVPQSFFRSVLVGALLAFCDQRMVGGTLQISLDAEAGNNTTANRLMLRMLPRDASAVPGVPEIPELTVSPAIDRPSRSIDWADVEAMAGSFGVAVARGEGYLAVGLPKVD
jgi:hypothetical protein